jgi:hypothetical protein
MKPTARLACPLAFFLAFTFRHKLALTHALSMPHSDFFTIA